MSTKRSTFSVVTPNFNMAHYLAETIESVIANLQPGDEYFIIDGASTDTSQDIIRTYESCLTDWVSEPDDGYAEALAKGFQRCSGDFLCWINSGDLLLNGTLQAARRVLTTSGADLIFGDDIYIDDKSCVIFQSRGYVRSLKHNMLFGGYTPLQDACFWSHSLYHQIGGINPSFKYAADFDFFVRASWAGRCLYVPKIFSAFRKHEGQKSIAGAAQYRRELQWSRKQMYHQLGIPFWKRLALEPFYWTAVRWHYRVARHLFSPAIPAGVSASTVSVT